MRHPLRFFAGCLLAVAALGAIGVWRAHAVADEVLERHRVGFREEVVRLRGRRSTRPALLLPADPGDASEVATALRIAVEAIAARDRELLSSYVSTRGPPTEDANAPVRALLSGLREELAALDGMFRRPCVRTTPTDLGSHPFPPGRLLWDEWSTLSAAISLARADGRPDEAIRLASATMLLGVDAAPRGLMFALQVSVAIQLTGSRALGEILGDSPLRPETLDRLAELLSPLRRLEDPLPEVWSFHRTVLRGFLADDDLFLRGVPLDRPLSAWRTWRSLYSSRIGRANALRALEALPETLPAEFANAPLETVAERVVAAYGITPDAYVANPLVTFAAHIVRMLRRQEASLAALELAVALARFEAEHGAWPASEADLVPKYLSAIPTSRMDPTGLRFAGGKAWSRGLDGDDDGGRPLLDPEAMYGDGDIVVEVKGHR